MLRLANPEKVMFEKVFDAGLHVYEIRTDEQRATVVNACDMLFMSKIEGRVFYAVPNKLDITGVRYCGQVPEQEEAS